MKNKKVITIITIIIALIIILFGTTGCSLDDPQAHCFYNYTDINGNTGVLKYCYTSSGQMICTSGDYKYKIKVVEYNRFCNEEVSK